MRRYITIVFLFLIGAAYAQNTANDYSNMALVEAKRGNFADAVLYLNKAIKMEPEEPSYHYSRGMCYYKMGEDKQCRADFDLCIKKSPPNGSAHLLIGNTYLDMRRFEDAEDYYDKGLSVPKRAEHTTFNLYMSRGVARHSKLDFDGMYSDYMEAYKIDSTSTSLMMNLSNYYRDLKDFVNAEKWLLKVYKLQPDNINTNLNAGFFFSQTNQDERAIKYFDFVIGVVKGNGNGLDERQTKAYAYSNRGHSYMVLKKYDKAADDFENSINLDPGNSYVFKNRAQLYIALDKIDKACVDLKHAIDLGFTTQYGPEVEELYKKYCK